MQRALPIGSAFGGSDTDRRGSACPAAAAAFIRGAVGAVGVDHGGNGGVVAAFRRCCSFFDVIGEFCALWFVVLRSSYARVVCFG